MRRVKINNFGPIKEGFGDNWITIEKVTIFIGNQGSGKSTIAKVISSLSWIEKAIYRGDFSMNMEREDFFELFEYQNIRGYFKEDTRIEYEGDSIHLKYFSKNKYLKIDLKLSAEFIPPKIMYVPAERNFLSVIKNAMGVRGLPAPLFEFAEELRKGQNYYKGDKIALPINDVYYKYDSQSDSSFIIGNDFDVNLLIASSGFQSIVPLFIVSLRLSQSISSSSDINPDNISVNHSIRMNEEISRVMLTPNLSEEEKAKKAKEIETRFMNKAFINIVEEPEQNLFPESQWALLKKLLEFNNLNHGSSLILTTHSPYLINYVSIAIQAEFLKTEITKKNDSDIMMEKLEKVIPKESVVSGNDVAIYQLDERDGTISKLSNTEGIPSDNNYLNESLRHGNEMFDYLLEIEQELEL